MDEQEFSINKNFPYVKVVVDKIKNFYVFKCRNCLKKEEYHFNYFKHSFNKTVKEVGEEFLQKHKQCKEKES